MVTAKGQRLYLHQTATCQFVCQVVYDVGVVQPPPVVLPPALDVDAGLPLKVRQVEVVPLIQNTVQFKLSVVPVIQNSVQVKLPNLPSDRWEPLL